METKFNNSQEIRWLTNYPSDQRSYLAEVYISVMNADVEQLRNIKPDSSTTLQVIHRIKGGLSSIGDFPLEQLIRAEENELKVGNKTVEEINLNTIKLISHRVKLVEDWLDSNNVRN